MELEDLAKTYLREMIKNECWDSMQVKGRSVKVLETRNRRGRLDRGVGGRYRQREEEECILSVQQFQVFFLPVSGKLQSAATK